MGCVANDQCRDQWRDTGVFMPKKIPVILHVVFRVPVLVF